MKSFGMTDIGFVRAINEDAYYLSDEPVGQLPNLYVVADGMGGHNGGEVASTTSIGFFVDFIQQATETMEIKDLFEEAIRYANEQVYTKGQEDPSLAGMGTTLVACTIDDQEIHVANVGDSRLYCMKEDLAQITIDHSVVEELFRAGHITEVEKYHHPDKNMITRAIGVEGKIKVDYFVESIDQVAFIVLCSDGLTKMVTDLEIEGHLEKKVSVETITQSLLRVSLDHGGKDNITIIVVDLRNEVAQ